MPAYETDEQIYNIFTELNSLVSEDEKVKRKMEKSKVSIKYLISEPDAMIWTDANGMVTGEQADKEAAITMIFPAEIFHQYYLQKISPTNLMRMKEVSVKGNLTKLAAMGSLANKLFKAYPDLCKKHGIQTD